MSSSMHDREVIGAVIASAIAFLRSNAAQDTGKEEVRSASQGSVVFAHLSSEVTGKVLYSAGARTDRGVSSSTK